MRDFSLFDTVVQPSVERIPLMDVQYADVVDDHPCVISHVVSRNVFTDFDLKLSRHLAAVRSGGFPGVTVTIRARENKPGAIWTEGRDQHFLTVPHALRGVARRAIGDKGSATLTFGNAEGVNEALEAVDDAGPKRKVDTVEMDAFGAALEFCRTLGAFEFLEVSGDFDILMVRPAGTDETPITIDLFRGAVSVPPTSGRGHDGFEGALYELQRNGEQNAAVRAYFAASRHAMTTAKEEAVLAFRAAAESRIHAFDRALANRPLQGHRLDAVLSLVARLRAGLGDDLAGISEDARITALDWAEAAEAGGHDFGAGQKRRREHLFEWHDKAAAAGGH
ncbi:MAG: hypothetical protein AAFU72_16010 [Pseudomonadota bacterium]